VTAFYNEIEEGAALWLEELIADGCIAPGVVDRRDVRDIRPSELAGFTQCHFFAGIGGWSLALRLAGWPDDRPVWTGSCPCQPFSAAGKGDGFADERHLWPYWHWLIEQCKPPVIFGEQVAGRLGASWLDLVRDDLEGRDYAFGSSILPAASVGRPHGRPRAFWSAYAEWNQQPRQEPRRWPPRRMGWEQQSVSWNTPWPRSLASLRALDDGFPRCVVGSDAARNAIVPEVAAAFIEATQWGEVDRPGLLALMEAGP
jgi:DNA (cytosine-5)-methyltransferase 1